MSAPDDGLERPWREIEDACRPILEFRYARQTTAAHLQDQDFESLIKDTAKSTSAPSTASEAFALLRYLVQTPDPPRTTTGSPPRRRPWSSLPWKR